MIREAADLNIKDGADVNRAANLRRRIREAGITIAEFRRRTGLTRNVAYAISKGRKPTADESKRIDSVLPK